MRIIKITLFIGILLLARPALADDLLSPDCPLSSPLRLVSAESDSLAETVSDAFEAYEFLDPSDETHGSGHASHKRADAHGPASIVVDHMHKPGSFMVEYKFAHMRMDGMRRGNHRVGAAEYFANTGFTIMPTDMIMEMHMLHFMYGLEENLTLYSMVMFKSMTMDHRNAAGNVRFRTHNDGLGDLIFGGLTRLYEGCNDELLVNLGFSAPTGDIGVRVPAGVPPGGSEFPYPMRLGSGTFNARPGMTYRYTGPAASVGAQFQANLPVGRNHSGYAEGPEYKINFWYARLLAQKISASFRVENTFREQIRGRDPNLDGFLTVVPTARPDMRAGQWVNFGYGLNFGPWRHQRLGIEIGHPVYQWVSGHQLETDLFLTGSWTAAW